MDRRRPTEQRPRVASSRSRAGGSHRTETGRPAESDRVAWRRTHLPTPGEEEEREDQRERDVDRVDLELLKREFELAAARERHGEGAPAGSQPQLKRREQDADQCDGDDCGPLKGTATLDFLHDLFLFFFRNRLGIRINAHINVESYRLGTESVSVDDSVRSGPANNRSSTETTTGPSERSTRSYRSPSITSS